MKPEDFFKKYALTPKEFTYEGNTGFLAVPNKELTEYPFMFENVPRFDEEFDCALVGCLCPNISELMSCVITAWKVAECMQEDRDIAGQI